jgi:polyphosphate kinase
VANKINNKTITEVFTQEQTDLNSIYNNPQYYINRELSWMEFNKRVLHQSTRKEVPLLERLKFLGITASNLDEFIMVRLASVLNKFYKDPEKTELSGLTPQEEYDALFNEILSFRQLQDRTYTLLKKKLTKNNMVICKYKNLSAKERNQADKIFSRHIYPLLTPITIDTTKDFPLIHSKQLCIIAGLEDKRRSNLNVVSIIPIDSGMDRLYKIESDNSDETKYVLLEEIIFNNLQRLFMNKDVTYYGCMRILREADIEIDNNKDIYIVDRMRQTLDLRENSTPIFMDVSADIPKSLLKVLIKIFEINKRHIYKTEKPVDLSFFAGMPIEDSIFQYDPFEPQYPEELIGEHDMFTAIDNNDIILHHPYETFEPVVKFLQHAAEDKDVLAIRQTLYRVSSIDSPIVEALCRAALKGKQVSVLLEIKARFDENRNMSLIEKLRNAGCKIIYGIEELKTHCKFILVVKKTRKGQLKTYCHIGTGNYNDKTAKIYTDLSYFTSNTKIGEDIITTFNILSGFSDPRDEINKIFYSPYNIRSKIYELIDREIKNAEKGKQAAITLKLNSLSDLGVIRRLYIASAKGVVVNVFSRGICSMKPINKNIVIRSLVGRYLEHSRIFFFYNNGDPEIFISSADLLTRNLDRRVEIMVPLTDKEVRMKVFGILKNFYNDTFNTYIMNEDGRYQLLTSAVEFNIHEDFMQEAINNYKFRSIPKITFKK